MRKIMVALVAIAAVSAVVFAGLGAEAQPTTVGSTVTIFKVPHHPHDQVRGKVLSSVKECRRNRPVSVFKDNTGAADTLVTTVNTGSDNRWGPVSVGAFTPGRFYASVSQVGVSSYYRGNVTCKADRSPDVHVK